MASPITCAMRRAPAPEGRLPFEYEVAQDEGHVTSYGGLPLLIDAVRALGIDNSIRRHIHISEQPRTHDEVAVIEALITMTAAGGDCLEDLSLLGADKALLRLLDRSWPSPETARKFLYEF